MLTFVLSTIATNYPDKVNDIGFFGLPGTDASKNGATIWMPAGTYIPKTTKNLAVAKDFLAFIASPAGVDAINAKSRRKVRFSSRAPSFPRMFYLP